ncbi:MAG TPA: hypothetical protein VN737_08325 [Bryobacteraceae bacterium]|nr:hypothetical protein [Bryobacteraceae bacterium]
MHRLRMEYDLAFRQWADAMDQFHERSELPDGHVLSRNQELSMYVEQSAVLYREARNRFANALLEQCAQNGRGRPESRAAAAAFASDSAAFGVERKVASGASFLGRAKPAIVLGARCCPVG